MAGTTDAANEEKSQIDFKEITSFIVEELSKRNLLRKGTDFSNVLTPSTNLSKYRVSFIQV